MAFKNDEEKLKYMRSKGIEVEKPSEPYQAEPEGLIRKGIKKVIGGQTALDLGSMASQAAEGPAALINAAEQKIIDEFKEHFLDGPKAKSYSDIAEGYYKQYKGDRKAAENRVGELATVGAGIAKSIGGAGIGAGFGTALTAGNPLGTAAGAWVGSTMANQEYSPVFEPAKAAEEAAWTAGTDIVTGVAAKLLGKGLSSKLIKNKIEYMLKDFPITPKEFIKDAGEFGNFIDVGIVWNKLNIMTSKVFGNLTGAQMVDKTIEELNKIKAKTAEILLPLANKQISTKHIRNRVRATQMSSVYNKYSGLMRTEARGVLSKMHDAMVDEIEAMPKTMSIEDLFSLKQRTQHNAKRLYDKYSKGLSKEGDDVVGEGYAALAKRFDLLIQEEAGDLAPALKALDYDASNLLRGISKLRLLKGIERAATFSDAIPFVGGSFGSQVTQLGRHTGRFVKARSVVGMSEALDEIPGPTSIGAWKGARHNLVEAMVDSGDENQEELSRSPQSTGMPQVAGQGMQVAGQGMQDADPAPQQSIPEQLINQELPRNSQELIANKKFVLAKVAQMMPEEFDSINNIYENHPEKIPDVFSAITEMMPHMFATDKYNRFDDSVAVDRIPMARQDLIMDRNLDPKQFTAVMDELNRTGKMEYTPRK